MRAGALYISLLAALVAGVARAEAPASSPRPQSNPRVAIVTAAAAETVTPQVALAQAALVPGIRPLPKPARPAALTRVAMSGASAPAKVGKPGQRGMICGTPGLTGTAIPAILSKVKGCGLEDGVKITQVSGIPLSLPATVDCATAQALKTWVDRGIVPAVGQRGGGVKQLVIAGSYVCRTRNHQAGAKVSEHGRGRAVDLAGIKLANGEVITVAKDWRREAKILKAVHKSACGPFGTVLGPQSDRFHDDHIHVDTARYRNGNYCK